MATNPMHQFEVYKIGVAAGILNVFRSAKKMHKKT